MRLPRRSLRPLPRHPALHPPHAGRKRRDRRQPQRPHGLVPPRLAVTLAFAVAVLAVPGAVAADAADAAALWQDAHGDDGVVSVTLPAGIQVGEQIEGAITFRPDAGVAEVLYKACEVGQTCFATGIPATRDGTTWSFDTQEIPLYSRALDEPHHYAAGVRAGFQFVVCLDNGTACPAPPLGACDESTDRWILFPSGLRCDDPSFDTAFRSWSETHYFGVDVADAKTTPAVGAVALGALVVLAAVLRARRW